MARVAIWVCHLALIGVVGGGVVFAAPKKSEKTESTPEEAASAPAPLPELKNVQGTVKSYLEKQAGYRAGDLITREQVVRCLTDIEKQGWQMDSKDKEQLLGKVLPEQSFLVRQFHTPAGTRFMRRIATYPEGYDRVQRLSSLQGGENRVRELITTADGYKMVEYMTKTNGGKNLGVMLGDAPHGRDFNKPTGTIYTHGQLEKALAGCYEREVARREALARLEAGKKK